MSRRRANMLANQIKFQFINAPQQIKIDFLRMNDGAFESEFNEFIQILASFQKEFDQLTFAFDTNNNIDSIASRKAVESKQELNSVSQVLGGTLKGLWNNYLTAKVVINPEIGQKIQAAESAALAKYMEIARNSATSRVALSARTGKRCAVGEADLNNSSIIDEATAEIATELEEIREEIMARLNTQDRLIESGRERVRQKLQERRVAAMATKGRTEMDRAQAILSSQEEFENNVDKAKVAMQRKLKARIEEKMKNRGESFPVQ